MIAAALARERAAMSDNDASYGFGSGIGEDEVALLESVDLVPVGAPLRDPGVSDGR
jgi:hypothetical protein